MDLVSAYPFSFVRNGLIKSYPRLDRDCRCDVVIVGGGITGALIAYYLSHAGLDTVLVDKRDIGTGSTCASTGFLQYEVDVPLTELVQRVGEPRAVRSYTLCLE